MTPQRSRAGLEGRSVRRLDQDARGRPNPNLRTRHGQRNVRARTPLRLPGDHCNCATDGIGSVLAAGTCPRPPMGLISLREGHVHHRRSQQRDLRVQTDVAPTTNEHRSPAQASSAIDRSPCIAVLLPRAGRSCMILGQRVEQNHQHAGMARSPSSRGDAATRASRRGARRAGHGVAPR